MRILSRAWLGCALLLWFSSGFALPSWQVWLQQLRAEAISQGIRPALFDEVFRGIEPNKQVIRLDRSQPERRLTFMEYRASRIDAYRINLGVQEYRKHRALLEDIGHTFGVDPCFVTAIWGIESSYGRYKGNFPVIKSLATLAYDERRGDFFRKELLLALHILNDGHVTPADFKGEWAGASGHSQFLPSSWHRFAVDYNQDGRKDIWNNHDDALASIANYLKQNGWQTGEPWSIQVVLPAHFPEQLKGQRVRKTVSEWLKLGVKPAYGSILPRQDLTASIVEPYGGPVFMIFQNYRVLLRYNNSIFYAGAVGYLADQICHRIHPNRSLFLNH